MVVHDHVVVTPLIVKPVVRLRTSDKVVGQRLWCRVFARARARAYVISRVTLRALPRQARVVCHPRGLGCNGKTAGSAGTGAYLVHARVPNLLAGRAHIVDLWVVQHLRQLVIRELALVHLHRVLRRDGHRVARRIDRQLRIVLPGGGARGVGLAACAASL